MKNVRLYCLALSLSIWSFSCGFQIRNSAPLARSTVSVQTDESYVLNATPSLEFIGDENVEYRHTFSIGSTEFSPLVGFGSEGDDLGLASYTPTQGGTIYISSTYGMPQINYVGGPASIELQVCTEVRDSTGAVSEIPACQTITINSGVAPIVYNPIIVADFSDLDSSSLNLTTSEIDGSVVTADDCGELTLEVLDFALEPLVTEVIEFGFDTATSLVTSAIATQLTNVGITNSATIVGQPIANMTGLNRDLATVSIRARDLRTTLKIKDCNDPSYSDPVSENQEGTIVQFPQHDFGADIEVINGVITTADYGSGAIRRVYGTQITETIVTASTVVRTLASDGTTSNGEPVYYVGNQDGEINKLEFDGTAWVETNFIDFTAGRVRNIQYVDSSNYQVNGKGVFYVSVSTGAAPDHGAMVVFWNGAAWDYINVSTTSALNGANVVLIDEARSTLYVRGVGDAHLIRYTISGDPSLLASYTNETIISTSDVNVNTFPDGVADGTGNFTNVIQLVLGDDVNGQPNLLLGDLDSHKIRSLQSISGAIAADTDFEATTFGGQTNTIGQCPGATQNLVDGALSTVATFNSPTVRHKIGDLVYISDACNDALRIWDISSDEVTTLSGGNGNGTQDTIMR